MFRTVFVALLLCAVTALAEQTVVVSRIDILGLQRTRRWVVEREMGFTVGDTITTRDLWAAYGRLSSLSIFNSVSVRADNAGVVTVRVPELWPLWPVLSVSLTQGHLTDIFANPKAFFDHATVYAGGTYINVLGTAAKLFAAVQFGATQGIDIEYRTRWVSPHTPLSLKLGLLNLREISRDHADMDSSRFRRDIRYSADISTREGAPSRVGFKLKYREVHVENEIANGVFVADLTRYKTVWFNPYVVLDRRDVEWFPTRGAFTETGVELVTGNVRFVRSTFDLRGYFPFTSQKIRPTSLALRFTAGTSTGATPRWAHFYYSFGNALRGYSGVTSESANYLIGDAELRVPFGTESTYNVPLIGRYGKNWPWGVTLMTFVERGELSLAGHRDERAVWGGGFYFRVPYFEILETSAAVRKSGHVEFLVSTGMSF